MHEHADRDRSEQPTGSDWRVQQVMHALINHEVDPATPYLARIRSLATFILDVIDAEPPHSAPQPPRSATNETGGHSGTGEAQGDAQERIQRYANALDLHSFRLASMEWQRFVLRVIAVADAEQDALRDMWRKMRDAALAAEARADRLAETPAKVRELHQVVGTNEDPWCDECTVRWPCSTVEILGPDPAVWAAE